MLRFYICDIVGDGTDASPFRPVFMDLLSGVPWRGCDGRPASTQPGGLMLVMADVNDVQHGLLAGDARVRYLPFENAAGTPLVLNDPLSQVSAANRSTLQTWLEARHVPIADLTGANTVRDVIKRIVRRFIMRQILAADDWTEGLELLVSEVPSAKRQRIAATLQGWGFDTSVVQATDTVREALRKLMTQTVRTNSTFVD